MTYDTIIVGAGIAGVSAALALSKQEKVLLIDAEEPAAGASGVAGGLFSPMFALRGRPIWRIREAIEAFHRQLDDADAQALFDNRGVLRPAHDEEQAAYFKQSSTVLPEEAEWLTTEATTERYPLINAPLGSMYVHRAGAVNLAEYVRHLAQVAEQNGVEIRNRTRAVHWLDGIGRAYLDVQNEKGEQERLESSQVILSWGRTFLQVPEFSPLKIHAVKGQTIRVTFPEGLSQNDLIPTSGKGYVIPHADHLSIGSSYEHDYTTDGPTPEISTALLEKASYMIPALERSTIIDGQAGFRVTVPGIRQPIVGPLPGYNRIWAFGAFGSKGLLMAPLLSYELADMLLDPSQIPLELRVRVKS